MGYDPSTQADMLIEAAEHLRGVSARFNWDAFGGAEMAAAIDSMIDTATKMAHLPPEVAVVMQSGAYACLHECDEAAADLEMIMERVPALAK